MSLLTCEYVDGAVREWHATAGGTETRWNREYAPRVYVAGPAEARDRLAAVLADDPKVRETDTERWFLGLDDRERSPVLRVTLDRIDEVRTLAREVRGVHERGRFQPGTVRLYNVDLAPGFRYCVDTDTPPVPARELDVLDLSIPDPALVDDDVTALTVDGETLAGDSAAVLRNLHALLAECDPDVLRCSTAAIVPLCFDEADRLGIEAFRLGRAPGWERLAGESTFESYGRVGHSPARYRVPGRAIVDRSNSFLHGEAGLPGLLDLVERSWRPLQETARGSIGTILTSIQSRHAIERGVLVPWNKWDPEAFKPVGRLHAADRGGFTFAPDVGIHEDVVEVDFASLYPNIMCEYNVSPETVGCDCHDTDDVPGLGYSICERDGFVPAVLEPIVTDRAALKEKTETVEDPDRRAVLESKADALKWLLVSSFGYQGYRNAKFGRIECHEAINAFAREVLLDAKETLEAGGWRVVHGIVDSLWIQPVDDTDQTPLAELAAHITDEVGITLEVEDHFEWVCFVPRRDGTAGTLTRYFGAVAGREEYKFRGIECRQRSTPPFVAELQRALVRTLDRHRDPRAVCDRLVRGLARLDRGDVPDEGLVVTTRISKRVEEYSQRTRTVAALERAAEQGLDHQPGQDVQYVVVDDSRRSRERVRLAHESPGEYDTTFYHDLSVRAAVSILSPLGWDGTRIRRYLDGARSVSLAAF